MVLFLTSKASLCYNNTITKRSSPMSCAFGVTSCRSLAGKKAANRRYASLFHLALSDAAVFIADVELEALFA